MAGKAKGSLKDEAKDKVKRKAKMEDVEALTRRPRTRARTRTRTGPGEPQPLLQGAPILSPLVASKTRGLRPVPRRKLNKNSEISVPTRMGTIPTPVNLPFSCGRRENCAGRAWTLPVPSSSDRDALGDLQTGCSGDASLLGGREYLGVLYTGATISIMAKKIVPGGDLKNIMPT